MGDETGAFEAVDADPTGRRRLLKQIAAGGAGVALVWAAPTITRTDRASAAASDPGGPSMCSFSYSQNFSGLESNVSGFGYSTYGPGGMRSSEQMAEATALPVPPAAPLGSFSIPVGAGNVDVIQVPAFGTSALPGPTVIGLGGDAGSTGAVMATLDLPPGSYTYLVEFDWIHPDGPDFTPRAANVTLGGPGLPAFTDPGSPSMVSTGISTDIFDNPAKGQLTHFSKTFTSSGPATITLSDTSSGQDGVAFTNFSVTCAAPPP